MTRHAVGAATGAITINHFAQQSETRIFAPSFGARQGLESRMGNGRMGIVGKHHHSGQGVWMMQSGNWELSVNPKKGKHVYGKLGKAFIGKIKYLESSA